jgi:hypothetical protein
MKKNEQKFIDNLSKDIAKTILSIHEMYKSTKLSGTEENLFKAWQSTIRMHLDGSKYTLKDFL